MIKAGSLIAAVVLGSVLTGCATVEGPSFQEARPASVAPGKALVYVFRKHAEPTMWSTAIRIGDRELATLSQGGFTWAYVTPGKYTIRGVWPAISSQNDSVIDLDIEAGRTYFVELTGIARMTGVSPGYAPGSVTVHYVMGSGLNERPRETAEPILVECCRFQKPVLSDF